MLKTVVSDYHDSIRIINDIVRKTLEEVDPLCSSVPKDALKEIFRRGIPKKPIYKIRPVWDCNSCRRALSELGRIVFIDDNYERRSIFEPLLEKVTFKGEVEFLNNILSRMAEKAKSYPIDKPWRSRNSVVGVVRNTNTDGEIFSHFHVNIPEGLVGMMPRHPDSVRALEALLRKASENHEILDILYDVKVFIEEGAIYRGMEKLHLVTAAIDLLERVKEFLPEKISEIAWAERNSRVAFLNSDVIFTLIEDVLKTRDWEGAINRYGNKVAPGVYRQPKDIITPTQIKAFEKEIEQAGFHNFLNAFKFATPKDLSVLDVIWTNKVLGIKGSQLFNALADAVVHGKVDKEKATKISFNEFLEKLKLAKDVEVDVSRLGKVALIVADFEPAFFVWGSNIGFCYETGFADFDHITQSVKKAGGKIDSWLRFSLYWENLDDLDLHLIADKDHVYFAKDAGKYFMLDVDMNVTRPIRGAVENIFARREKFNVKHGKLFVKNFEKREAPAKVEVGVYLNGKRIRLYRFENPPSGHKHDILEFSVEGNVFKITKEYLKPVESQEQEWQKIDTVLLSPNWWEANVGNQHLFFLKKGAEISLTNIRPFNLEQVRSDLASKHRRVLQALAKRVKVNGKPELVGWGISFAKPRELFVKLDGRPYIVHVDPKEAYGITKEQVAAVKAA